MVCDGRYGKTALPLVPLSDGAGVITALGPGVSRWNIGDRVAVTFFKDWQTGPFRRRVLDGARGGAIDGMLSEYVTVPEDNLVSIPSHLSFEEAATLPCAGVTAWQALVTHGHISANQTVLILGTGGVSMFALQFAKMHGARVIVTSSSEEKLARAQSLGADELINYRRTPDWDAEVFKLTARAGADQIIEVGGTHTFPKSLRAAAVCGTLSVIGGVSGFSSEAPLREMLTKMLTIRGIFVGNRDMFEAMMLALAHREIKPVIDRVFPFNDAPAAYAYQASGAHFGKVVIGH
jgi:NADPH:quinone reductase-like Zn-dependent oxidoreductase